MSETVQKTADAPRVPRKVLIVGGPKLDLGKELMPHDILRTRSLEGSFEVLSENRPDVIVHFVHKPNEPLEEAILTWLIGGFRGNLVVFDPHNKLGDFQSLLGSNIIDAYVSGPVSPSRFVTIIKSHLNPVGRGGTSRTYALFELFRHLFERGMDAIFFFTEDLSRCVAANLQAERLTGRTLFELRRTGLADICGKGNFAEVDRIVRRARHSYYDARGHSVINDRLSRPMEANFSAGLFHFGRTSFVKFEIQNATPVAVQASSSHREKAPKDRLTYKRRNDDRMAKTIVGLSLGVSMLVCRVHLEDCVEDEDVLLETFSELIRNTIRRTDSVARLSRVQFAILLPKASEESVALARKRLRAALSANAPKGCRLDFEMAHCPPEAYPFLQLLENAAREDPERKRAFA